MDSFRSNNEGISKITLVRRDSPEIRMIGKIIGRIDKNRKEVTVGFFDYVLEVFVFDTSNFSHGEIKLRI